MGIRLGAYYSLLGDCIVIRNKPLVNLRATDSSPSGEFFVKRVVATGERLAVFQFRYTVIVEELGVQIPAANHEHCSIEDDEDSFAHIFAAYDGGEVVGTCRVNFLRDGSVDPHSRLMNLGASSTRDVMSVSSRFLVAARYRGTFVAVMLIQAWYRFLRASGIESDYILVKSDLADFYARIGYRPFGDSLSHPEVGEVLPLWLSVLDETHLRAIRSPFVRCFLK